MNLEERLRRVLSDDRSYTPSPDAWARVQSRVGNQRELSPQGKILTIGFALAIGMASVVIAVASFSRTSAPTPGAQGVRALTPRIVGSVDLDALLIGVLPMSGEALAIEPERSLSADCDGAVGRATVAQDGSIELTSIAATGGTPQAASLAGDTLWIAQQGCGPDGSFNEIVKMGATTGQLIDTFPMSQVGSPSAISVHGSSVFTTWQQTDGRTVIVASDANTGQVIGSNAFLGRLAALESTDTALWALDSGPERGFLLRVDPATLRELDRLPLGESPSGLVVSSDGSIWVGVNGGLARVDPSGTMTVMNTAVVGPTPIGADADGVWFFGASPLNSGSVLVHIDSASFETDSSLTLGFAVDQAAVDSANHQIWASTTTTEVTARLVLIDY